MIHQGTSAGIKNKIVMNKPAKKGYTNRRCEVEKQ
jgi:hypothetical protein